MPPAERRGRGAVHAGGGRGGRQARKYLPAARDYFAASLWRRLGLRINETVMLDIRDWRPDLGERSASSMSVTARAAAAAARSRGWCRRSTAPTTLIDWWLAEVRHQFGDDWADPDAPMLPSERRDPALAAAPGSGADALRTGWPRQTDRWLPAWSGRLTPHVLRHYCASSLYARGMDLKALQELLGPPVAVHHDGLHPRAQRPHRAGLDGRQPAACRPASATRRTVNRCTGTCG